LLGMSALAGELGARAIGAWVGGLAYACAPWRLSQGEHLHILSTGGIPITLYLLLRGYRRRSWRLILAGWLVACWQVSLGFGLGLQFLYLLVLLAGGAVARRLRKDRRVVLHRATGAASLVGIALLVIVSLALARPYMHVLDHHPEAERNLTEVARYSPSIRSLAAA